MILITSAAYISNELRIEFGVIPPCLLPIGNRTLLEYQAESIRKMSNEKIFLTLPEDYCLSKFEERLLDSLNIRAIYLSPNLSLGESIYQALDSIGDYTFSSDGLKLLHGDTLINDLTNQNDIIAVAPSSDDYFWEKEEHTYENLAWCGYFTFSMPNIFKGFLEASRFNFVQAVRSYDEVIHLSRMKPKSWDDLGHLNTYFISRSNITTQRAFNEMRIQHGMVWKSSKNNKKILAETNWYKKIPALLKSFTPQLIEDGIYNKTGNYFYTLEYLPYIPLNEIFVHGKNPDFFWRKIFNIIKEYLFKANSALTNISQNNIGEKIAIDSEALYRTKTFVRLTEYAVENNISIDKPVFYDNRRLPSLHDIASDCIDRTTQLPIVPSILHGDLCFSNILFNSRLNSIKVLDPRGISHNGEETILGDQKYDLAKLCHSVIGLYDYVISGRYHLDGDLFNNAVIWFDIDTRIKSIQQEFYEYKFLSNISVGEIMPLTTLLFLSMLPLHSDRPDRQKAMLFNALRIYSTY
ncbi:TPA: hypothetical protein KYC05_004998, partial [Escherichia coli]|nr:hypothetical protein [Escherichia coli]